MPKSGNSESRECGFRFWACVAGIVAVATIVLIIVLVFLPK